MMIKHIEYGDYEQLNWNSLEGLDDPLLIKFIDRLKELNWGSYNLFLYGGIIEGWETFDVDGSIIGPRNPAHINYLLDNITRIGFEMGIYPDIKWATRLFDWQDYIIDKKPQTIEYANYRGTRISSGRLLEYATLVDGLYMSTKTWPLTKTLNKNHNYSSPLKLF